MDQTTLIAQAALAHAVVGGLLKVLEDIKGLDAAASCLRTAQKELSKAATAATIELEREQLRKEAA